MTHRENWLRCVEFRHPEWIPAWMSFAPVAWHDYREDLEQILLDHPRLWPGYEKGSSNFYDEMPVVYRQGEKYRDNWGCMWYNQYHGLEGQVVEHPLADWSALASYRMPDPLTQSERGTRDWEAIARGLREARARGDLVGGDGERLFDRLYFLRGFDNLMLDLATDDPHLPILIERLTEYELKLVNLQLEIGVDFVSFHTDIGMQTSLMISPAKFRQYIKPMFMEIFQTVRHAGAHVGLSSDGNLTEIVDDLVECGVSWHGPQFRAAGLEGIVRAYKGKLCAQVDLDRQAFPFLTAQQCRDHVRQAVEAMCLPEGGVMVYAEIYGSDVPLANIDALAGALEEYCLDIKP